MFHEYTTPRVLTMEWVEGERLRGTRNLTQSTSAISSATPATPAAAAAAASRNGFGAFPSSVAAATAAASPAAARAAARGTGRQLPPGYASPVTSYTNGRQSPVGVPSAPLAAPTATASTTAAAAAAMASSPLSVPPAFAPSTVAGVAGSPLAAADAETRREALRLVDIGVRCSLEQMLEEGFYHADPHPGEKAGAHWSCR